VRLAGPDASDADLQAALRGVRIWTWVARVPDGWDTPPVSSCAARWPRTSTCRPRARSCATSSPPPASAPRCWSPTAPRARPRRRGRRAQSL